MSVAVVIVAGGVGFRAGGEVPKQYQLIGGRPVIWWTLQAFLTHPGISYVQAVIGRGQEALFAAASQGLVLPNPVEGGATRQDSCRIGIEACAGKADKILIHDAARPFVSAELIAHIIAELDRSPAVIPALPLSDTIKRAPGGLIEQTISRQYLWAAQTPQGFIFDIIRDCHQRGYHEKREGLTDDASVAEAYQVAVRIIAGRDENKKLTTQQDIQHADQLMRQQLLQQRQDIRVGQGIDFHEFEQGQAVILCGVTITHDKKLKGHSDADVALHAITDAILGAIGEGDIGQHFPPSDSQWRGVSSLIFLDKAVALLEAKQGLLANLDLTLLAEAPRIGPHIAAMKAMIAPHLRLKPEHIAIKATTTEKLGAIGRQEGMAAFATVLVRLP